MPKNTQITQKQANSTDNFINNFKFSDIYNLQNLLNFTNFQIKLVKTILYL